ncbi:hypothetical protein VNO80_26950 [Phaseolus coccineus]|uniref:Uncharacterized protein n=1 Tax=Phaseolus coccineus TaxID=3886 RepID=A0AAN9LFY0_PHACN
MKLRCSLDILGAGIPLRNWPANAAHVTIGLANRHQASKPSPNRTTNLEQNLPLDLLILTVFKDFYS